MLSLALVVLNDQISVLGPVLGLKGQVLSPVLGLEVQVLGLEVQVLGPVLEGAVLAKDYTKDQGQRQQH